MMTHEQTSSDKPHHDASRPKSCRDRLKRISLHAADILYFMERRHGEMRQDVMRTCAAHTFNGSDVT